ncbi:MAG: co-chaperone GroES [Myxococcota bacterium]
MALQPLNGNVLVRPVEAKTKSAGGILLPEVAREAPAEGVIQALPPGDTAGLTVGARVLYKRFAGEEIQVDGEKYRLLPHTELLAKFVEADAIPA